VVESSKKPRLLHKVSAISDVTVEGRQDISSPSTSSTQEDVAVEETLVKSIHQRWRKDSASIIGNNDKRQCQLVLETLLADKEQLERILIARKYKLDQSTDLFFEQVRFRARWKPQSIRPQDIPNALPCECLFCVFFYNTYLIVTIALYLTLMFAFILFQPALGDFVATLEWVVC
jgi:hypothetical protein